MLKTKHGDSDCRPKHTSHSGILISWWVCCCSTNIEVVTFIQMFNTNNWNQFMVKKHSKMPFKKSYHLFRFPFASFSVRQFHQSLYPVHDLKIARDNNIYHTKTNKMKNKLSCLQKNVAFKQFFIRSASAARPVHAKLNGVTSILACHMHNGWKRCHCVDCNKNKKLSQANKSQTLLRYSIPYDLISLSCSDANEKNSCMHH